MNASEQLQKHHLRIPITYELFWYWLLISSLLSIISVGYLVMFLLIPLTIYWQISSTSYLYNDDKLIIKKGVFTKSQEIIPLYKIESISSNSFLGVGKIIITVKGKSFQLDNVKDANNVSLLLIEKWENSKQENIRNEIF